LAVPFSGSTADLEVAAWVGPGEYGCMDEIILPKFNSEFTPEKRMVGRQL